MKLQLSLSLSLRLMARGEPCDTCQYRSPPLRHDVVRSLMTRGSGKALLTGGAGSEALGHVTVAGSS
jgi:hypothetical protein